LLPDMPVRPAALIARRPRQAEHGGCRGERQVERQRRARGRQVATRVPARRLRPARCSQVFERSCACGHDLARLRFWSGVASEPEKFPPGSAFWPAENRRRFRRFARIKACCSRGSVAEICGRPSQIGHAMRRLAVRQGRRGADAGLCSNPLLYFPFDPDCHVRVVGQNAQQGRRLTLAQQFDQRVSIVIRAGVLTERTFCRVIAGVARSRVGSAMDGLWRRIYQFGPLR